MTVSLLRTMRTAAGLSAQEMAARLRLSRSMVTKVERGERNTSDRTLQSFADICRKEGAAELLAAALGKQLQQV